MSLAATIITVITFIGVAILALSGCQFTVGLVPLIG